MADPPDRTSVINLDYMSASSSDVLLPAGIKKHCEMNLAATYFKKLFQKCIFVGWLLAAMIVSGEFR